ncbi:MAG: preprotein translocase subunit SecE [Candidatus Saccharimonadales bacterium]
MVADKKTTSKKNHVKKTQTVRDRAEKLGGVKKTRKIKRAGGIAAKPFQIIWKFIKRILHPFRFVLRPFKTRPMRFIGRMLSTVLLLKYFRNSWLELKQVEWPDRKETTKLSVAVFVFAIFFSLIIAAADYGLDKVFKHFILK